MRKLVLVVHNVRSCHNVGSLLRTADGLGVNKVYLTGYTPHPKQRNDTRLPHIIAKIEKQVHKTALGAEHSVAWRFETDIFKVLKALVKEGYAVAALEQTRQSTPLIDWTPPQAVAFVVGREVEGLEHGVLETCDQVLEIPMFGKKESFNVAQAAAMALFYGRFTK